MWRHSPFWEGRVEVGRGSKVGGGGGGGGMYVLKLWCLGFKLKRVVGKGYGKYYKGFSWFYKRWEGGGGGLK